MSSHLDRALKTLERTAATADTSTVVVTMTVSEVKALYAFIRWLSQENERLQSELRQWEDGPNMKTKKTSVDLVTESINHLAHLLAIERTFVVH